MPIEPPSHFWMYELKLSGNDLDVLEMHIENGRAEYVAGKLIGLLRANRKIHIIQKKSDSEKGQE